MKNHFGQSRYQSVNGESPRAAWAEQGALRRACVSLEPLDIWGAGWGSRLDHLCVPSSPECQTHRGRQPVLFKLSCLSLVLGEPLIKCMWARTHARACTHTPQRKWDAIFSKSGKIIFSY